MKIAIYTRKSRMTDKGESIHNQIDACKHYILGWSTSPSEDVEFLVYTDEGFSGGNTDRPEFKKMMNDVQNNKFNKLICYRLDRISRNIADFSNTYALLQAHNIEFVSVKEQFDTSTPIGRAMLNIAMVFAQLERETIAERVSDNMRALAKTGRWLGGKTPTGFISKQVTYKGDLSTKKMYVLECVSEEIAIIRLIYDKFLEIKSLRGVESYLLINDILTPTRCKYTASTLKEVLTNPVYASADEDMFNYFSDLGSELCNPIELFNGTFGLMVYNRTNQTKKVTTAKDPSEWIVAIGKHEAIISGAKWVYIQRVLNKNTTKSFYNKESMNYGLLTTLIKCKHCGSTMKIKKGKLTASGEQAFTYVCSTKDISRKTKCNMLNLIGQVVDKEVTDYLLALSKGQSLIMSMLSANSVTNTLNIQQRSNKINDIEEDIVKNDLSISNLMSQLAQLDSTSSLLPHYLNQLKEFDTTKKDLENKLKSIKNNLEQHSLDNLSIQMIKDALDSIGILSTSTSIQVKRSIVRTIIDKIQWDGEQVGIELFGNSSSVNLINNTHLCCDRECHSNC